MIAPTGPPARAPMVSPETTPVVSCFEAALSAAPAGRLAAQAAATASAIAVILCSRTNVHTDTSASPTGGARCPRLVPVHRGERSSADAIAAYRRRFVADCGGKKERDSGLRRSFRSGLYGGRDKIEPRHVPGRNQQRYPSILRTRWDARAGSCRRTGRPRARRRVQCLRQREKYRTGRPPMRRARRCPRNRS